MHRKQTFIPCSFAGHLLGFILVGIFGSILYGFLLFSMAASALCSVWFERTLPPAEVR